MLKPIDNKKCRNYLEPIQRLAVEDNKFVYKLIMSDNTHFHFDIFVNKYNCWF